MGDVGPAPWGGCFRSSSVHGAWGDPLCCYFGIVLHISPDGKPRSLAGYKTEKKKKKKKGPDPISKTVTAFLGEKSFYEAKRRKFGAGGWSQRQNRDQKR